MALDKLCPIRSPSTNVASAERGFGRDLVGTLYKDDASDAVFKLAYCLDGDCTAGRLVGVDVSAVSGTQALSIEICPANGYPVGVAKCTFASASFGLVQVSGYNASAVAGVTLPAAGSLIVAAATAGSCALADLTTASHAARVAGVCLTAPAASADAFAMFIKGIL